tara:strand:- start:10189 stop:11283 length:1095 start_codon:yes stop_codon:yes gene_type:complete
MKKKSLTSIIRINIGSFFSVILFSCGSFQPTSYFAEDGIYGNDQQKVVAPKNETPKSSGYTQYFDEKSKEYVWDDTSEDYYFKDSENYSSANSPNNGSNSSQGQWGSSPQRTNIYIVGSPIDYNFGYLGYDPYLFNNGFGFNGGGFYGRFNNFYNPYRWGYFNAFYPSFGFGFYNPYYYERFYPYDRFYNNSYNRYANRYQPKRRSYSNSRRGGNSARRSSAPIRTSSVSSRKGGTLRSINQSSIRVPSLTRNGVNVRRNSRENLRNYSRRYITTPNDNPIKQSLRTIKERRNSSEPNHYKPKAYSKSNNYNSNRSSNSNSNNNYNSSRRSTIDRASSPSRSSYSSRSSGSRSSSSRSSSSRRN